MRDRSVLVLEKVLLACLLNWLLFGLHPYFILVKFSTQLYNYFGMYMGWIILFPEGVWKKDSPEREEKKEGKKFLFSCINH